MADEPQTYATSVCPYCSVALAPLPKAKERCPACGLPIHVRSGPDGYTYLLQERDLPVLEQAWAEHEEELSRAGAQRLTWRRPRPTRGSFACFGAGRGPSWHLRWSCHKELWAKSRAAARRMPKADAER